MVFCLLCLESLSKNGNEHIEIYSEVGCRLEISKIISTHFWLDVEKRNNLDEVLCQPCWDAVQSFHTFYLRIAAAHNYLEGLEFISKVHNIEVCSSDGLKSEKDIKEDDIEITSSDFFVTEVKVEVQDLELLPATEVIEENAPINDRTLRSRKRNRILNGNIEFEKGKSEVLNDTDIKYETGAEMTPECSIKTSKTESDEELSFIGANVNSSVKSEMQKKRRGRPRKVKDVEMEATKLEKDLKDRSTTTSENEQIQQLVLEILPFNEVINSVKYEQSEELSDHENEFIADQEFLAESIGTEDSESSSSESNESDESWKEPEERYAEIPKRVVVKPKKYRKRQKPNAPIKRMSREEIERKRAQQAEYDKTIAKFFEKFACPVCNLLVSDFGTMKAHFRASHRDETGYMSCCGRKFHLRKTLAEHVLVHWNPDHFKCETCSKVFQDSRALELHNMSHLYPNEQKDKKTFQCDKCPKAFTTKAAFEYHSFSKHVPKSEFQFSCTECNKKLPTSRKLKDHMKYAHDPQSTVICDKCGKQMRNQSSLKKHHEIEHSDKPRPTPVPMQCEICGTWLRHAAGLKQHMKTIHEDPGGEHRCHICNKTSSNARALKRHIYHNHECERKFKCTMCEKAFKRPQDLREHTSTHTGEVLYTCPNCPMTFFSNANMYKHRQRLHRAEWEADRKKPRPPNIMGQAISATAAMKMKQAVGAANAFFASSGANQLSQSVTNSN